MWGLCCAAGRGKRGRRWPSWWVRDAGGRTDRETISGRTWDIERNQCLVKSPRAESAARRTRFFFFSQHGAARGSAGSSTHTGRVEVSSGLRSHPELGVPSQAHGVTAVSLHCRTKVPNLSPGGAVSIRGQDVSCISPAQGQNHLMCSQRCQLDREKLS